MRSEDWGLDQNQRGESGIDCARSDRRIDISADRRQITDAGESTNGETERSKQQTDCEEDYQSEEPRTKIVVMVPPLPQLDLSALSGIAG